MIRSMLAVGLSWKQALPAIAVGHIIIAAVMVRLSQHSSFLVFCYEG
jgi:cytosine/uracil/thiamine/allantoin permease